ncbi:unnamed protein product, partial [Allacma fusca]
KDEGMEEGGEESSLVGNSFLTGPGQKGVVAALGLETVPNDLSFNC